MWKPPEKIKYQPEPGVWPSKAQAENSLWFSSVGIGRIQLATRTWIPAMVPWRSTEEGIVTDQVLAWYERFAQGQPGCIVIEATGIRDVPSGPLMRIGHDRFIPGLKELADTVHRASDGQTKLFIQLIDFLSIRRRPEAEKYFQRFLRITDSHRAALDAADWSEDKIREHLSTLDEAALEDILTDRELDDLRMGARERVTDVEFEHIHDLPKFLPGLFADAAERAQKAGIDGVELHYAHAYTMASFLSRKNTREDGYGGPRENRARLPLEVFAAVRERVGDMACGAPELLRVVVDEIEALSQRPVVDVHVSGAHNICVQPEFRDALDVASVLELLEHKQVLAQLLAGRRGVVVTIGDENDRRELRLCSLVTASYDVAGSQGVIGVMGPTRMPYERVVALVDYAASRAAQLSA